MKKFKSQNAKGKVTSTFAKATADKLQNSKLVLVLTGVEKEVKFWGTISDNIFVLVWLEVVRRFIGG